MTMQRRLTTLAFLLAMAMATTSTAYAQSNAAESRRIALNPNCYLLNASINANSRIDITTQEICNIGPDATAVDLYVTVAAATPGWLKIWEYDGLEPSASVIYFPAGVSSFYASPRACAPWGECFKGISVKASADAVLKLIPAAFYRE